MRLEFSFSAPGSSEEALERLAEWLMADAGFEVAARDVDSLKLRRGSRLQRALSLRIECWPTTLDASVYPGADGRCGVVLRYDVQTGIHMVGTLEKAIIETEAALLQEWLETGIRRRLGTVVAGTRRPVVVAVMMNALLAVLVVAVIGLMAGFHPLAVGGVALAVGVLDGITISAFADLLLEGSRRLPRVRSASRGPSEGSASPGWES